MLAGRRHQVVIPTAELVVVPTGANFLVVGVLDSLFVDNSDAAGNLAVQINQITAPSPEPATFGLLAASLAGLAWMRQRRTR